MINKLKKIFYFPVAFYFAFFAKLRLLFWKPKIIVVTGSSGKTTLLHMIESQLGKRAKYSHHANSAYGIPFDILGLKRKDLTFFEWPFLFLKAPYAIFKPLPKEKIYIVEADCDRPGEGKFLGKLLKPDITLWLNTTKTHCMNFEKLEGDLLTNITLEFGQIAKNTKDLLIYNKDQNNIVDFVSKLKIEKIGISKKDFKIKYQVTTDNTEFKIDEDVIKFKYLLPEASFYQLVMCLALLRHLGIMFKGFDGFLIPPGRSSIFKGIKNTTLIDSTYNANLDSMKVILSMFNQIKSDKIWAVLGDMLEQGENEKQEHNNLAKEIKKYNFQKIILMGPRVKKYAAPNIKNSVVFETPDKVLEYLKNNITGGEVILFKGARFLEGVIEKLLLNKEDSKKLVRREKVWQKRREKFRL